MGNEVCTNSELEKINPNWGVEVEVVVGVGVGGGLCPAVGFEPESLPLSLSDRLSFSPAHSWAVQPAAITTPQPLCHSNAVQSLQSTEGRERD